MKGTSFLASALVAGTATAAMHQMKYAFLSSAAHLTRQITHADGMIQVEEDPALGAAGRHDHR